MAAIIRLINFKAVGTLLGFALILLIGQVERIVIGASNLKAEGSLALNPIL
jgi:hypothetical protein